MTSNNYWYYYYLLLADDKCTFRLNDGALCVASGSPDLIFRHIIHDLLQLFGFIVDRGICVRVRACVLCTFDHVVGLEGVLVAIPLRYTLQVSTCEPIIWLGPLQSHMMRLACRAWRVNIQQIFHICICTHISLGHWENSTVSGHRWMNFFWNASKGTKCKYDANDQSHLQSPRLTGTMIEMCSRCESWHCSDWRLSIIIIIAMQHAVLHATIVYLMFSHAFLCIFHVILIVEMDFCCACHIPWQPWNKYQTFENYDYEVAVRSHAIFVKWLPHTSTKQWIFIILQFAWTQFVRK